MERGVGVGGKGFGKVDSEKGKREEGVGGKGG